MEFEFNEKFLNSQKSNLLQHRQAILNNLKRSHEEEVQFSNQDRTSDETDLAQAYIDQSLILSLRDRDLTRLREIDYALSRIEDGTYGLCEESGEQIELKRLEKQPWAKLSLYYAEQLERERGISRRTSTRLY